MRNEKNKQRQIQGSFTPFRMTAETPLRITAEASFRMTAKSHGRR
jgi:hypothetical protein